MQPRPSKSRPTARKRVNADDSAFIGPSSAAKRGADKVDGALEPRAKRKRMDVPSSGLSFAGKMIKDGDTSPHTVDFHSFPTEVLYRYLIQTDAIPHLYPSPSSTENPPLPNSLLNSQITTSRALSPVTAVATANRARRDPRDGHRRRSSRLLEEEERSRRAPILADAQAVHPVLATLAERHFEKQTVKETDALQQFIHRLRR